MTNLPIRIRLTLVFACSMAIVLLATGAFLFVRVGNSLDHNVQEALETRSAELGTDLREGISISTSVLPDDQDEQFAQVVGGDGRVIDATSRVRNRSLLTPAEIDRVVGGRGPLFATIDQAPGVNGHARLFARQVNTAQGTAVLVTGMSLEERQATVRRLLAELLVIGPAALLVASLLGYWVASAALRPVESMRAEAAEISAEAPGRRLSLPASRDELRRLGETLNSTLERLEAALRLERTFVADASHEMRSPIARLKAELELALRRRRTAGELEGTVRSALAEAELLARLSENLLFLARSDHGNLPLRRHDVSVPSLFATVAARFQPAAERDGRTIEIEDVADGGLVGDSSYLEQALSNAVENSLRHGAGTVTLLAVEDAGRLELHVLDQGPGFSDGFLPQAFSRFTREEEARTSPGTGLGLSIIGAIALAHGGSAGAANRQGGGADVWLSLPTEPPPS